MSASSVTREDLQSDVLQQFRPCKATGWARERVGGKGLCGTHPGAWRGRLGDRPSPGPPSGRPGEGRGTFPSPTAAQPPSPNPGELRAARALARHASPGPGLAGRPGCGTNLAVEGLHGLHVVCAEARGPAKEEAAAGRVACGRAGDGPRRPRSTASWRRSSAPVRSRHGRGAGAASRTEAAGAGRRRGRGWRGAFSASPPRSEAASTLKLRPPPLSTPFSSFLFLPRAPVSPPCRLGRGNLQRAAKTQEEALTAAAAASNMADAVEPRTQSRRRRPARPLATRPREACGRAIPSRGHRPERPESLRRERGTRALCCPRPRLRG